MKFITFNIFISFVVLINCKLSIKSTGSFPHRLDKDYIIIFEELDVESTLKLSVVDRHKKVEQIEINFTKSAFNNTNNFEEVYLNYKTKSMKIKFKKECNMKKLIIYDKLLGHRLYRKVVDLINLGTLMFNKEDVILNGTRYIKYTCVSKDETYFSIPKITINKNLTIISQKYERNPNSKYVLLLIKPEDDGVVMTCSDEVGAVKKLIIYYDGHPNKVKIMPNFRTIRINETLHCKPYPKEAKTKLTFKWTVKIWNNETFNYSNKSLNLFELNKLSKCDYLSVTCEIKSSSLNTTKFLYKTIQFIKTNSNEENVRTNIDLTKQLCIMENRIWNLEKETKLKENISSHKIDLKRSNQKISSNQIDLKKSNQIINSLQIDLKNSYDHINSLQTDLKRSNQNISSIQIDLKRSYQNINSLQTDLKRSNQNIIALQTDLKRSNQNIIALQTDLKRSNQNISSINKELIKHKNEIRQSLKSIYVWRVDDIIRKREDAKRDKSKEVLFSDPFFTKKSGYKLRLVMYLNGWSTGLNTHLGLGLQIMKSGHDEILTWPCTDEVKLSLMNTRSKTPHTSYTFSFKEALEKDRFVFDQPTKEFNTADGSPQFVSWTDLLDDTKKLIKDGSIYIKVDLEN